MMYPKIYKGKERCLKRKRFVERECTAIFVERYYYASPCDIAQQSIRDSLGSISFFITRAFCRKMTVSCRSFARIATRSSRIESHSLTTRNA